MSNRFEHGEEAPRWRPRHGFGVLGVWAGLGIAAAAGQLRRDPNRNAYEYAVRTPGELRRNEIEAQEAEEDRQQAPYIYTIEFTMTDPRGSMQRISSTDTDELHNQVTGKRRHPGEQEQWDELRFAAADDGDDDEDLEISFVSLPQPERNHYDILWAAGEDLGHCLAAIGLHDVEPSYVELKIYDRRNPEAKQQLEMNTEYEMLQTAWQATRGMNDLSHTGW